MPKTLIIKENAQRDLDEAYEWFYEQRQGLGKEFAGCVRKDIRDKSFSSSSQKRGGRLESQNGRMMLPDEYL